MVPCRAIRTRTAATASRMSFAASQERATPTQVCVVVVTGCVPVCVLTRRALCGLWWAGPACTPNSREENCGDIDGTRALWDFFVASVAP